MANPKAEIGLNESDPASLETGYRWPNCLPSCAESAHSQTGRRTEASRSSADEHAGISRRLSIGPATCGRFEQAKSDSNVRSVAWEGVTNLRRSVATGARKSWLRGSSIVRSGRTILALDPSHLAHPRCHGESGEATPSSAQLLRALTHRTRDVTFFPGLRVYPSRLSAPMPIRIRLPGSGMAEKL